MSNRFPKALCYTIIAGVLAGVQVPAADWAVSKTETLSAPAGLEFTRIDLKSPTVSTRLHVVTFSAKTHAFAVMDDPQNAYDLASAAKKRAAVAAVNGGYFRPDRTPLGLRVRQSRELHPIERAKLLSGLLTVSGERIALVRVGEFKRTSSLREAIQAGPFLVDAGKPVTGLNATRADARTAIFTDGASRWGLVVSDSVSLADAGAILAMRGLLPGLKIQRALNLDGGSSTGLWVAGEPPFYHRELRNVRDFVGVVPK
jgi:uncharacterized protein YigE (DUF2233 family)